MKCLMEVLEVLELKRFQRLFVISPFDSGLFEIKFGVETWVSMYLLKLEFGSVFLINVRVVLSIWFVIEEFWEHVKRWSIVSVALPHLMQRGSKF